MHNPPCESWEQHVDKAYSALGDHDTYDLLVFTDFLLHTWQDEQLAADPDYLLFLTGQQGSVTAPSTGREGAGLERALPSSTPEAAA